MSEQSTQLTSGRFAASPPPPPLPPRPTLTVGDGPNEVIPFDIAQSILRQLREHKPSDYKRYLAEAYVPSNNGGGK